MTPPTIPSFEVDHVVVGARTLDEGAAWCEATLGVVPEPGGRHIGRGTHNRLVGLTDGRWRRSYLEIIAIDPEAPDPPSPRWFDLDDDGVRAAIARTPTLLHWVARTSDIDAACDVFRHHGIDPGAVAAASRETPRGTLSWRISGRADGRRTAAGAVPLVIAWGPVHPTDALAASDISIEHIAIGGVDPALAVVLGVVHDAAAGAAPLGVRLQTPRGRVELRWVRPVRRL